jgi:hypothetical protein
VDIYYAWTGNLVLNQPLFHVFFKEIGFWTHFSHGQSMQLGDATRVEQCSNPLLVDHYILGNPFSTSQYKRDPQRAAEHPTELSNYSSWMYPNHPHDICMIPPYISIIVTSWRFGTFFIFP